MDEPLALVSPDGETLGELVASEGTDHPLGGFAWEWRDFLEQIRTGTPSRIDASTVRQTTALIEAAYRAAPAEPLLRAGAR